MLGHDASFGYIKAVELAASSSIIHKRTGYLLCSACLSPSHEFRFMLVNQMQRDISSSSILEICGSLIAVTSIITSDMVPAMQGLVFKMLDHSSEIVRKKAIIAIHRFHQLAPEAVERDELVDKLRKVLCDRDPSVMGSSLNVIESLATVDPKPFKELVPSLISILKQVIEHRLPSDYEYHRVPAPVSFHKCTVPSNMPGIKRQGIYLMFFYLSSCISMIHTNSGHFLSPSPDTVDSNENYQDFSCTWKE